MCIVTRAEQGNVLDRRGAPERVGLRVLEREEAAFAAATTRVVNEAALPAVAPPDLRNHLERHMARARLLQPAFARYAGAASPHELALVPHELALDEHVHGALEQSR